MQELADFDKYLITRGYRDKTREAYYRDLRLYFEFAESIGRKAADQDCVFRYLGFLSKQGMEGSTIERKRAALVSFSDYYFLKYNVRFLDTQAVSAPRKAKRIPNHYSQSEIESLLAGLLKNETLSYRTYFMILFLYSTGLRLSEALSIKAGSINERDGSMEVMGKGGKSRLVFLPAPVISEYQRYKKRFAQIIQKNNGLFFNKNEEPLTARGAEYILKKAALKASWIKNLHPHAFRHSYATALLEEGADVREVAELLGHASLATTQRYTHLNRKKLKADYAKFHPHG